MLHRYILTAARIPPAAVSLRYASSPLSTLRASHRPLAAHRTFTTMSAPVDASVAVPTPVDAAAPAVDAAATEPKAKSRGQLNNEKGKKAKNAAAAADGAEEAKEAKAIPAPWVMPEYMEHRIKCWDAAVAARAEEKKDAKAIKITLPDGKVIDGVAGVTTPLEIAKGISNSLAEKIIVAKVRKEQAHACGSSNDQTGTASFRMQHV